MAAVKWRSTTVGMSRTQNGEASDTERRGVGHRTVKHQTQKTRPVYVSWAAGHQMDLLPNAGPDQYPRSVWVKPDVPSFKSQLTCCWWCSCFLPRLVLICGGAMTVSTIKLVLLLWTAVVNKSGMFHNMRFAELFQLHTKDAIKKRVGY